ncbi:MAG: tetratricopeptide repeat protein, partial [Planctomycetota bacterium]
MRSRRIALLLALVCGTSGADWKEDLVFAQRLGSRGLKDLAQKVLDQLARSADPQEARAGRFGLALLTKQDASRAAAAFLRDVEEGKPPRFTREQVVELFGKAIPDVKSYVETEKQDVEAHFHLAELLQDFAVFLTGRDYPDEMAEERAKLIEANRKQADELFQQAVAQYEQAYKKFDEAWRKAGADTDDRLYDDASRAELNMCVAQYRWASIHPPGPAFTNRVENAITQLDEFLGKHFEDLQGATAMLYLGLCYLEKGQRAGSVDDVEVAIDFFRELYTKVPVDPEKPYTGEIVAQALYYFGSACNTLGRGGGKFKKPLPVYFDTLKRVLGEIDGRLKVFARTSWALRAKLQVADAHAAREEFDAAVAVAGDALSAARFERHGMVQRRATARLTDWVASVRSVGDLDPGLLYQIGESLAGQGRTGSAVAFYEKAISASATPETQEKWAVPARLRIADVYRRDGRLMPAAMVATRIVDAYLKSGEGEESPFGQTASNACNLARTAWKQIAEATKRAEDDREYQRVLGIFREKFPGHPENSDAAFSKAVELLNAEKFAEAAEEFRNLSPSSRNYWRAQRTAPHCWRALAKKDASNAAAHLAKSLEVCREVMALAEKQGDDAGAKLARQHAHLYFAVSLADLKQWPEALASMDDYLARYPDQWLQRGLELDVKLHAHLETGELEKAESALQLLREKVPASPYLRSASFDVYSALRQAYEKLEPGSARTATAERAARLFAVYVEERKASDAPTLYTLGKVLEDAGRFEEAGDAYEGAAENEKEAAAASQYKLKAAEMKFRAAQPLRAKDRS